MAGDWARYRGPNGSGVSADGAEVPVKWSEEENVKWKIGLPGPGHSSPIIVGDKIFLTCWSGYATDGEERLGDQKDLRYHLLCLDREDGSTVWDRELTPELPEEEYRGMFAEHGYTTHTPASDGKHVYAFFGRSGVIAFDLEGKQLWHVNIGKGRDHRGWGSASSPILHGNHVIVLASIESSAVVALDKQTGKEVWREEADGLRSLWGTPILAKAGEQTDLVIVINGEIWGLNPESGKLRWICDGPGGRSISISAISHDGVVYALGGREGGTTAVRAGGKRDVNKTHFLWDSIRGGGTGTPVYHDGRLHWINEGMAYALDAKTGDEVYRERIEGIRSPAAQPRGNGGGGGIRGTRDYPSPVVAGNKLYQLTGSGDVIVVKLGADFELVGINRLEGDGSRFVATPAVSAGDLFIRSNKFLYCVGK